MSNTINQVSVVSPAEQQLLKEKKSRRDLRSIIYEFCLNTSIHGLPGIARSESIHNRIFWSISFLSFTGIMIYCVIKAILNYFEYPTQIDVSITGEWPQHFPAFSFCNAGPIRFDQFIEPFVNYTNRANLTNINDTTTLLQSQILLIGSFVRDIFIRNESMNPFFYSLDSMLHLCLFNSMPCTRADFISFTSATYGLCYTFNAKLKTNSSTDHIRYGNQYGGEGKLELGLYVHSHQYVPHITTGIGIIGLVHDNTQVPLMETAGLELIPGRKHKLSYRKKRTIFLSSPYSTCTDKVSFLLEAMLDNYPQADYKYSDVLCFRVCLQLYTYNQCGCVNPFLWDARAIVLPGTNHVILAPLCNSTDSCFVQAADIYMSSPADPSKYCSFCPQPCSITEFNVKKSSLLVPLEWHMNGIKKFVEKSSVPLPANWSSTWREHIHRNYLIVSVIRETNIVETNAQIATLGLVDVLSNVGGQTGLWIGISFLSMMELIEMFYRLFRHRFQTIRVAIQRT